MAWTVPNLFVAGATLAAAELNKIRDSLKAVGDPWTTYTPTLTASTTNPVLNDGSSSGAYIQAGQLVVFRASVLMGASTTYGSGGWQLTLPVIPKSFAQAFDGWITDASASAVYSIHGVSRSGSTTVDLYADPLTAGNPLRAVSSTVPMAWGNSDRITFSGIYEAA